MAIYKPLTVGELIEILKLRNGRSHVNVSVFDGVAIRDIQKGEWVSSVNVSEPHDPLSLSRDVATPTVVETREGAR